MKWGIPNEHESSQMWHKWYAWYPVKLTNNQWAWLEVVERRNKIKTLVEVYIWEYRIAA